MMDLEEAIKHAEEVAYEQDMKAGFETDYQTYIMSEEEREKCRECAEEHRQLAEWLKELKAYREQSGDAISRQAVMDCFKKWQPYMATRLWDFEQELSALPSATPQQRTGQWILADEQNKEDVENDNYRFICSECQCSDIHAKDAKVPYCWKCGAKMEVEE